MRLGSLRAGGRDGALIVVSADGGRYLPGPVSTLQAALEDWEGQADALSAAADQLQRDGTGDPLDPDDLHAPLPRAYQYCEGSTYLSHMERCRAVRNAPLPPGHGVEPAVLQSCSDRFLAPTEPVPLADEAWGLDLEVTVAVITGDVPSGVSAAEAPAWIRLVVLLNDFTLRNVLPGEFAKGLGFFQSKPLRPFAPFAVTPESLGPAWDGRLLHATVRCWINDELLGSLDSGADASFDFGQVIAHAAHTRPLAAGTIVGTGTISNLDESHGVGALAEKRALQHRDGLPLSPLLRVGDTVAIEAFDASGNSIFGAMRSAVVQPKWRVAMSVHQQRGWQDGWTAEKPAQIGFAWAPNDSGDYLDRHGDGFVYRDLGVQAASGGALGVQRMRVGDPSAVGGGRALGVDFDFLYLLAGSVTVRSDGADDVVLGEGGAALHPRGYRYRLTDPSSDFDAVHVTAPAHFTPSGDAGSTGGDGVPVYTHDTLDTYVQGQGPRAYFRYRDLGTRGPTDGRIHFHVVSATEPGEGTGWHYHTMAQWFMVIGGSAVIRVEARPRYPIAWGDAMCVGMGPDMRHNVTDFTGDYKVLELCLPADYETIAVDEPSGADHA